MTQANRNFKLSDARKGNMPLGDAMAYVLGKPKREPIDRYAAAFQPIPGSTPVTLTDLGKGQCKWPVGENPTVFCGEKSETGRYCEHHERMSGIGLAALA
jgi:hypothetical protein